MIDDAIFLSVKPKYAKQILSGEKTVELRRNRPRLANGSLVVLYVSSPVKAVLGAFYVDRVVADSPEALWPLVEEASGLTREEYDAYYDGATQGVGIFVRSAHSIRTPYGLADLRRDLPHFHPPQAYRYLRSLGEYAQTLLDRIGWNPEHALAGD